jgi:acyl-CoA thioester hydrolase
MTIAAPLDLHRETVLGEWIDYNGHMNVAYYVLAFDHATDAFFDFIGFDEDYRRTTGYSTFAVESHVTYQREVAEDDALRFTTQLLGFDEKRLHYIHHMYHAEQGFLAATSEWLSLHVDLNRRRVAPMPEAISARLAAILAAHGGLPVPPEAGRAVRNPILEPGRG